MRFDLTGANDRELPLILGLMPVLAKHADRSRHVRGDDVRAARRQRPLRDRQGRAGPQHHAQAQSRTIGDAISPINRGLWNFDEVRFDFYRDANSHLEAFKKGLYDVRTETDPGRWETAYDVPAVRDGRIVKETFPTGLPKILSGLVFNTRRPVFADVRVREAIGLLFDFEWLNHNFFFDRYQRTASYFEGSELSARGRPADATRARAAGAVSRRGARRHPGRHLAAAGIRRLGPRPRHAASARSRCWTPPATSSTAPCCARARRAQPFTFEILVTTRDQERLALAFARDLKRAGIAARVRVVDAVQYDRRRLTYDFDMIEIPLGPVAVARQRAGVLLGLRRRRRRRHPQLHGRQKPGDRRHDRRDAEGPRARRIRRRGARARPRADVGLLRRAALSICRRNGSRAGPRSRIRPRPRCSAICRKPGGASTRRNDRSAMIHRHRPTACRRPRSTICSAAPPRAGRTPSRWPIRRTAKASPTARRAA